MTARCLPVVVLGLVLAPAVSADAATLCADPARPQCHPTAAAAFAAATDGDSVELGPLTETAPLDDAGRRLTVIGAGTGRTVLSGGLVLGRQDSSVTGLTVHGLELAGTAAGIEAVGDGTAAVRLHGPATVRASTLRGAVGADARDGSPRLENAVVRADGPAALLAGCGAELHVRHVTVVGAAGVGADAGCDGARIALTSSIVWGPRLPFSRAGSGRVDTEYSAYAPAADHLAGPGDRNADPGFEPDGVRLAAGSPLLDAGSPAPLGGGEPLEDAAGLPRAADGDGDGIARRDPGAYERQPAAVALPSENLLVNPGAEGGTAAIGDGSAPEPPGWMRSGAFTFVRYGAFPFPSLAVAGALGGGGAFFAGGPGPAATASQVVELASLAPEIDRGVAVARLSALLGGFGAGDDAAVFELLFRDPSGIALGAVSLGPVGAAARASATLLAHRARSDAVPPLTRSAVVIMRATRVEGSYADAYFDNLALVVAAPGSPPFGRGGRFGAAGRPFAGARVLTRAARLDARGRLALRVACPSATVTRCTGVITLTARLRPGTGRARICSASVSIPPGRAHRVRLRLDASARRAVSAAGSLRTTLFVAVRDGQGLTRNSTVPMRVRRHRVHPTR